LWWLVEVQDVQDLEMAMEQVEAALVATVLAHPSLLFLVRRIPLLLERVVLEQQEEEWVLHLPTVLADQILYFLA
jgi:hypothetical protein